MTTVLAPVLKQKFFDGNGAPLAGGKLFSYVAGTSTKIATYTGAAGTQTNSNPIILDYRGEANVWIEPNVGYKFVLADASDTDPPSRPIFSVDQVRNSQLLTLYGGVDTGSANNYVLNFTAPFTSYTDGIVIYWVPNSTNTGASTLNVNSLGPVPVTNPLGGALVAGQLIAGQFAAVAYQSGSFTLLSFNNIYLAGTFVGTLTGCTTSPTQTFSYVRSGAVTSIYCNAGLVGTSNATSLTITGVPGVAIPATPQNLLTRVTDNGTVSLGVVAIGSSTMTFGLTAAGGAFTNSGSKGIPGGWSITFPA